MNQTIVRVPPELDLAGITTLTKKIEAATGRVLVLKGEEGTFCRGMSLTGQAADDRDADNRADIARVANRAALGRGHATPSFAGDHAFAGEQAARERGDSARIFAGERGNAARAFAMCLRALRFSNHPTIAVVDGVALGGGVGIAAACDLVVATPRASFGLPELLFGLMPAIVFPILVERISPQRARLLALRAQSIPAARAVELGLADEVVPVEELATTLRRFSRELSRVDSADFKRHTAEGLDSALDRGAEITAAALADPRLAETMRAFVTEGTAPWLT